VTTATGYLAALAVLLDEVAATDRDLHPLDLNEALERMIARLFEARAAGKHVYLVGNGGSASIVGHLQMDLCNALQVRAQCFHDIPTLTALSNDFGYPTAFRRGLEVFASPGDVLIAVSSSGRSQNILDAVATARDRDLSVLTFSGFAADNPLRRAGDINLYVNSSEYGQVETAHACLSHMWTDLMLERDHDG
jgi:D-sedoheptulose 7-phosphate isomerase